jgi:hypothetical protein
LCVCRIHFATVCCFPRWLARIQTTCACKNLTPAGCIENATHMFKTASTSSICSSIITTAHVLVPSFNRGHDTRHFLQQLSKLVGVAITCVQDFEVCHPHCVSNKSNYKAYVYIVRHNYVLGGMLFMPTFMAETCSCALHIVNSIPPNT